MTYFVFGVNIFFLGGGGGGGGGLRNKISCEVHHRLKIMNQSFVTNASPDPLSRAGIAWQMCCDFTFTLSL